MRQYIAQRLLISIPVFIGITIIMFFLINSAPGDPLAALINPEMARDEQLLQEMTNRLSTDLTVEIPEPSSHCLDAVRYSAQHTVALQISSNTPKPSPNESKRSKNTPAKATKWEEVFNE